MSISLSSVILAARTIAHMSDAIRPTLETHRSTALVFLAWKVAAGATNDIAAIAAGEHIDGARFHGLAKTLYTSRLRRPVPKEFIRFVWSVGSVLNWAALEAKKAS